MHLRYIALYAAISILCYNIYHLLPVLGVFLESQKLMDINIAMAKMTEGLGYLRVLLRTILVDAPLIVFLSFFYFSGTDMWKAHQRNKKSKNWEEWKD